MENLGTTYDWNGLRSRRICLFIGIGLVLPGSCVASLADHFGVVWVLGFAVAVSSLVALRFWRCPRCRGAFAALPTFPFVRPFATACAACGLPDFTRTAADAPAPVSAPPVVPGPTARPFLLRDKRARIALVMAVPLIWITTCRLPAGQRVQLPSGHEVSVLGVANNIWTSGGVTTRSIVVSYYAPEDSATYSAEELLHLAAPAIQATGDSLVVLQAIQGDWWARAFGIRISRQQSYSLLADGSWQSR